MFTNEIVLDIRPQEGSYVFTGPLIETSDVKDQQL